MTPERRRRPAARPGAEAARVAGVDPEQALRDAVAARCRAESDGAERPRCTG